MTTKKITIEIETSEGITEKEIDELIELLKKGAPLGVEKKDLRKARQHGDRTRY